MLCMSNVVAGVIRIILGLMRWRDKSQWHFERIYWALLIKPLSGSRPLYTMASLDCQVLYLICRNKCPDAQFSETIKKISKPTKTHRFYVLPSLKNDPSKLIGFMYSPLWKITHQKSSVLCTPPFEKSLFLVSVYLGKYGTFYCSILYWFIRWPVKLHFKS